MPRLAIVCLVLYGATRNLGMLIARALGPTRAFGWLFGSAFGLLATAAGLAFSSVLGVLVSFWGTFMFLPWNTILALAGAGVLAFGAHAACGAQHALRPRRNRRARRCCVRLPGPRCCCSTRAVKSAAARSSTPSTVAPATP